MNERDALLFAAAVVQNLNKMDAWLCSVPHGQYETYSPHTPEHAKLLLLDALALTLEEGDWDDKS